MKKVANRIQKVRVFAASRKMPSGENAVGYSCGRRKNFRFAVRVKTQVAGPIAQQQKRQDKRDAKEGDDHHQGEAPAIGFRQSRDDGQESQLASGVRRGQDTDDQAALFCKPARCHRGAQHDRRHARAGPDHNPPEQGQLPNIAHPQRQTKARDDKQQGCRYDAFETIFHHQGRGEGRDKPQQDQPHRQRRGNILGRPMKFLFKRRHQHAGGSQGTGGRQHGEEGYGHHHPAVVDVAAVQAFGEGGGDHGVIHIHDGCNDCIHDDCHVSCQP